MLGHLAGDDVVISVLRGSLEELGAGQLSGEGQGGKRVHDHVDPEKLNGLERRFLKEDSSNNSEDEGVDVDSKLELEETLDVIIDVTAPRGSLDDGEEGVILDDDVSGGLAHSGTGDTHTEADIGLGEGGSIVGTITGDGDDVLEVHQTSDKKVLVLRAGTGHDLELGSVGLELGEVANSLNTILDLETTHELVELGSLDADHLVVLLMLLDDSALLGDSLGSVDVVTSDHADSDTSVTADFDGSWDLRADNIVDTEDTNEGEALGLDVLEGLVTWLVVVGSVEAGLEVTVSEGNGSEGLAGELGDNVGDELALRVTEGLGLTILVEVADARFANELGSTLDDKTAIVAVLSVGVLENSGHTLTGGAEIESDSVLILISDLVVNAEGFEVNVGSLKEVNHTLVGSTWVVGGVASDGGLDEVPMGLGEVVKRVDLLKLLVLVLVSRELNFLAEPSAGDLHLVKSKGTSLVRADVVSTTHDLAGSELLDHVVVLEHLTLRVGEGDHDGKRETFWDSDDNNGDTNDDVVNPELEVLGEWTVFSTLFRICREEVDVALEDAIKEVAEEEHVDGQKSGVGAELSDLSGDDLELLLERSGLRLLLKLLHDLTEGRPLSNDDADHLTRATLNVGSGEEQWGGEVMSLSGGQLAVEVFKATLSHEFLTALEAGLVELLEALIGLTGHSGLVASQVVGFNANTVDGDDVTDLQMDDVTGMEFVDVKFLCATLAIRLKACHHDLNLN